MPKIKDSAGFVFKRTNSPFYYARWWVKGKEHVHSTGLRTKPEAEIEKDRLVALSKGEYSLEKAFNDFLSTLSMVADLEERERLRCKFVHRIAFG